MKQKKDLVVEVTKMSANWEKRCMDLGQREEVKKMKRKSWKVCRG